MTATLRRDEEVSVEQLPELLNRSPQERARIILSAAKQGELEAQVMLGQILLQGSGIERDPELAITWFRLATQQ